MITVKEILQLSILNEHTIIAGENGLSRIVKWAHVIDHTEIGYFLEGGELLFTCGQIWPSDSKAQRDMLHQFLTNHISGIVFAVGRYLEKCPDEVIEFGQKYAIPIIEVPFHVQFVKVTRAIHEEIMRRQYRKVEVASRLSQSLIDAFDRAGNDQAICAVLANNLNFPAILTNNKGYLVANSFPDGNVFYNVAKIKQQVAVAMQNIEKEPSTTLHQNIHIIHLQQSYHGIPIQNKGKIHFYLWIYTQKSTLTYYEKEVLFHAKDILEEMLLNMSSITAKQRQIHGELFNMLLEKNKISSVLAKEKIRELNIKPNSYWAIGIIPLNNVTQYNYEKLYASFTKFIEEEPGLDGFCDMYNNQFLLLLTYENTIEDFEQQFTSLLHEHQLSHILFGRKRDTLLKMYKSYRQLNQMLTILPIENINSPMILASEYRKEIMLYGNIGERQAQLLRSCILPGELLSDEGDYLLETLKVLMHHQYNREQAAKALHIHRNTLRYRIEKIENFLGDSLSSIQCQFWIKVAFDIELLTD